MIEIKASHEINIMRECGKISIKALDKVLENVKAGITTLELDSIAHQVITSEGATPSFMTVDDYKYTTCINVNEGIVHGLPGKYRLKKGDLVSIDLGAYLNGFHTDLSYTVEVETSLEKDFLAAGKKALQDAVFMCALGQTLGDVGHAIQAEIERHGWTVSRDLVGHGVGKELHESPLVPGYGKPGKGLRLVEGMVLAIEVIYQKGLPQLALDTDGWTYKTADNSLSALFEQTVAIVNGKPEVLTPYSNTSIYQI